MPSIFHMEANLGISLHFPVTLSIRNLSAFSISFASAFTDAEINWFSLFFRESHSIQQQCSSLIPQQYQQFLSFRFLFWLIFFLFFRCFRCQGKKKPWKTAFMASTIIQLCLLNGIGFLKDFRAASPQRVAGKASAGEGQLPLWWLEQIGNLRKF